MTVEQIALAILDGDAKLEDITPDMSGVEIEELTRLVNAHVHGEHEYKATKEQHGY